MENGNLLEMENENLSEIEKWKSFRNGNRKSLGNGK